VKIAVIGAGPVGMLLACAFKRTGSVELKWHIRNDALLSDVVRGGVECVLQEFDAPPPQDFAPPDPDRIEAGPPADGPQAALDALRAAVPDFAVEFDGTELAPTLHELAEFKPDVTFACVKAQSVLTLRHTLGRKLRGLVFFVVNGFWLHPGLDLGVLFGGGFSESTRVSLIPRGRLVLGRVKSPHADFEVTHKPHGPKGTLIYRSEELDALKQLMNLTDPTLLRVQSQPDVYPVMLRKAVLNSLINPLAALSGQPNGVLLLPEAQPLLRAMAAEILALLREAQFLPPGGNGLTVESILDELHRVCADTAHNRCSLQMDLLRGRPHELPHLNGMLLNIAARYRLPLPVNRTVLEMLRFSGFEG